MQPEARRPIQVLRERRGGVPRELLQRNRHQRALRRKIAVALKSGAKTVPELAAATGEDPRDVLWYVMGMKKYGKVAEAEASGSYFKYALVDDSQATGPNS
jgi:hypothetical protein